MKEHGDLVYVDISDVDLTDNTYTISFPHDDPRLEWYIGKTRLITPVLLLAGKPLKVIDGLRRIRYASKLELEAVPAYVLSVEPYRALMIAILANIARGLNIVEKAHAIAKMCEFGFSDDEIFELMGFFGLGRSQKIKSLCIKIASEEETIKFYFCQNSLSMKTIGYFFDLTEESRKKLLNFLQNKKITESSLREFLELVLLAEVKFGDIPFSTFEQAQTIDEAKFLLKKEVSPSISALCTEFFGILGMIKLPNTTKIKVDPFFEKEEMEISILAKSVEDVDLALKKLQVALGRGYFEKIFALTQGKISRA
ncbi:MAG: ParB/RepB/Spo0J family partition protein [Desulfobacterota bacterium]|nr:ParB/RepB/Spo0J family partition protein [Thermodesulfobacteriota bacterium]MDW8002627.1 ParB/RepB/Spo0J family partition protein [Deltaproteobacteria bacterium]